jgi:hypothetical protein
MPVRVGSNDQLGVTAVASSKEANGLLFVLGILQNMIFVALSISHTNLPNRVRLSEWLGLSDPCRPFYSAF